MNSFFLPSKSKSKPREDLFRNSEIDLIFFSLSHYYPVNRKLESIHCSSSNHIDTHKRRSFFLALVLSHPFPYSSLSSSFPIRNSIMADVSYMMDDDHSVESECWKGDDSDSDSEFDDDFENVAPAPKKKAKAVGVSKAKAKAPAKKTASKKVVSLDDSDDDDDVLAPAPKVLGERSANDDNVNAGKKSKGKKTVEQTYQKMSQLEHILKRPDTYSKFTSARPMKFQILKMLVISCDNTMQCKS